MKTRSLFTTLGLAALVLTCGCNGPTKAGKEARSQARSRIDQFSGKFAIDQAKQDFEAGQFDRALNQINRAIVIAPGDANHFVLRGRVFLEQHELEQAVDAFLAAADMDPELPDPHYYLGIIYQRWSDDEKALQAYEKAFELDHESLHYLLAVAETMVSLDRLDDARALVNSKMTYFERDAALRHMLGQIALLEGDLVEAARLYEEATSVNPEDDGLLEELAWVQYEAEMYGPCLETVRRLLPRTTTPEIDLVHLEARCLTLLDHSAEAHGRYVELTKRDPANVDAWIEFGTLAWKLGDYRRMAECSVHVIQLAPDRFEGHMLKGLFEQHRGRLNEAVALLSAASERGTNSPLPHLLFGRALEQKGEEQAALDAYRRALSIDFESAEAKALLHALERRMGVASAQ